MSQSGRRVCKVDGCDRLHHALGCCKLHHHRLKRYGDPTAGGPPKAKRDPNCTVQGCGRPHLARGLCNAHYIRLREHGDTQPSLPVVEQRDLPDRLWSRVDVGHPLGCWVWTGYISPKGYGQIGVGDTIQRTHRVAYELLIGPIPKDIEIDHLCRNRACCNPDHLEPVIPLVNFARGESILIRRARSRMCAKGLHELTGDNLKITSAGHRRCRACRRASRAKRRAAA